jgi:putative transposase
MAAREDHRQRPESSTPTQRVATRASRPRRPQLRDHRILTIDCHTKKVVGYAMDDNYKTPLIVEAVRMAARNVTFADDAIFHSDRGSNYTSSSFSAALAEHGARQSVGRTGICYDNAMAESFFGTLKNERVHRTVYPTRERARADIAQYIELRYNSRRIHSGLGYRTPQEVHDAWLNSQEAA